jgi:thiamine transporter ThiT
MYNQSTLKIVDHAKFIRYIFHYLSKLLWFENHCKTFYKNSYLYKPLAYKYQKYKLTFISLDY